jgi:hypothetical protein
MYLGGVTYVQMIRQLSQSICIETPDQERLSLDVHNVEWIHLAGRCTL